MQLGLDQTKLTGRRGGVGGPPPFDGMFLGTNLGAASTNNSLYPFVNIMWNSKPWQRVNGAGSFTQQQGVLTASVSTDYFMTYLADGSSWEAGLPEGDYTVINPDGCKLGFGAFNEWGTPRYTGGYSQLTEFTFNWTRNNAGLFMFAQGSVTENVKVILPNHMDSYNAGEIFSDDYIAFHTALAGLSPLRMMIWADANGTAEEEPSQRSVMGKVNFQNAESRIVPWEVQCQMANRFNRDIWVNVPTRASQAYVNAMAAYFAANLNPARKIWVETGNEHWNNAGAFANNTSWMRYWKHTKVLASVDPTTNIVTKANHGLVNDDIHRVWNTYGDRLRGAEDDDGPSGSYRTSRGNNPLHVEVIDANTFKLWDRAENPDLQATFSTERTECYYVLTTEAGKNPDGELDSNHVELSYRNWLAFDTAFGGTGRVKAIIGAQGATPSMTTARLAANATWTNRCDHVAIAPYYSSLWFVSKVDISTGQFWHKTWTPAGGTDYGKVPLTVHFGVYADGSNPTTQEVINGNGTGFVAKSTYKCRYGGRYDTPVTISVASPAVVTWATTAPANGSTVKLFTTGALPTGLTASSSTVDDDGERIGASTTYYVVNSSGNTCNLADTAGGAAINTTAAGSGTHTADTGETGSVHIPGPTVAVVDGTPYKTVTVWGDPDGYFWRKDQNISASATPSTVGIVDTYANQVKRDTITMLTEVMPNVAAVNAAIDASTKPSITLVNYEAGSHWFHMATWQPAPDDAMAWIYDGYVESQEYADIQKIYLQELAARDTKGHAIFVDITDQSISWTLANSLVDLTDKRLLMTASLNGRVNKTALIAQGDVDGADFATDPGSFPQTVHTFTDNTLTYTILKGAEAENYAFSGLTLQMTNDVGIDWGAPMTQQIKVLVSNGTTQKIITVSSGTGSAWYEGDAHTAVNMVEQADANLITAKRGGNFTPAATAGTLSGGLMTMTGASNYINATAGVSALTLDDSTLAMIVIAQGGAAATSQSMFQIGSSQFLRLSTSSGSANQVRWRLFGGADTGSTIPAQNWSATAQVIWIFFDKTNNLVVTGSNQTTANSQAFSSWTGNTLARDVRWNTGSNPKIGSFEVVKRAGMTLAQAKAMVQKVQDLHSIV